MDRAYALLAIKSVREDERVIEGIASTPSPDRMDDVVDPMGAKFALPMPLLWQHRHDQPIGHVEFAKPTPKGIPFKARIAKADEPGLLKDRLDEAWQSIKLGLVRAVSIGFRALDGGVERLKTGGLKFTSWEWLELSAVTIPAQQEATITSIKSIDRKYLAASGRKSADGDRSTPPGVSGLPEKPKSRDAPMQSVTEQIADYEAKRDAAASRMKSLMNEVDGDITALADDQLKDYDDLADEVKAADQTLARLKAFQTAASSARPVTKADTPERAASLRTGLAEPRAKAPELPKGTAFTRYVMSVAAGRGSVSDALEYAKRWNNSTPEVSAYIKAEAGTSTGTSPGWGAELVYPDNLASEFVDLLRPMTVMGRIEGFRRVPFNVRVPVQVGGSTVNWVGEAAAKPVTQLEFSEVTLSYDKIAGIVVLSEELVRLSSPSAEATVRRDLTEQIAQFMDEQFLDPSITVSASRPASVTQGVSAVSASGTDADALYYDLNQALAAFDAAEIPGMPVVVTTKAIARGISTLRNAFGQFEFSGMNASGGTLNGMQVIVSNSAPAGSLILINPSEIFLADDGGVRIDASNQATIDMAGGNSPAFSLWQKNMIGIRAERWVTYKKRRAEAVALITGAEYGPSAPTG